MLTQQQLGVKPPQTALRVERFRPALTARWNAFVAQAKNATFLFQRDYMDYHSERFLDHSLLIYQGDELCAVLPAHLRADGTLVSHEGLTYGGLVVARSATLKQVLSYFLVLARDLEQRGIARLRYKRIPHFYNALPDGEVDYALFLLGAQIYRRDCASVIMMNEQLPLRKGHHSTVVKAKKAGITIKYDDTFQPFWEQVLAPRLGERYGVRPVHTLEEITLLASRFPRNIKQFSAYLGTEILAGMTIYETPSVAHAQYCAATELGRKLGAQTYLASQVLHHYRDKQFFDFGISNEQAGRFLNHGLQDWKEGFGARAVTHDFYEVETKNHPQLAHVLNPTDQAQPVVPALGSPSNTNTASTAPLPALGGKLGGVLTVTATGTWEEFALQFGAIALGVVGL